MDFTSATSEWTFMNHVINLWPLDGTDELGCCHLRLALAVAAVASALATLGEMVPMTSLTMIRWVSSHMTCRQDQ